MKPRDTLSQINLASDADRIADTVKRLRNRAWLLRIQAYVGILLIVVLVISLITTFSNHHSSDESDKKASEQKSLLREPYDYRKMDQQHIKLSDKINELIESSESIRQEVVYDKYADGNRKMKSIADQLDARVVELRKLKSDIDERVSKDRANLILEISALKDERNNAMRDSVDKKMFLLLIGDVFFRVGALVLTLYLSSLVFSVTKYLLRVADHLNSIADCIDLSMSAGISIEGGVKALTPHPIDFHVDDGVTVKTVKEVTGAMKGMFSSENKR